MSIKSALIISGAILAAALGIYWIAAPREACPEELYRQYMQLSPFEQFDQKEKLLKKAAQAGCIPAMRQMADHNFISKNDLKAEEYNYWIKKRRTMEARRPSMKLSRNAFPKTLPRSSLI